MQFVALTFEKILWWHFIKIQIKPKRDFPAACDAEGCDGEHCLPASLAFISPHARGNHQNDETQADITKEKQKIPRKTQNLLPLLRNSGSRKTLKSLRTQITLQIPEHQIRRAIVVYQW